MLEVNVIRMMALEQNMCISALMCIGHCVARVRD